MKKIFTLCVLMALVCVKSWGQSISNYAGATQYTSSSGTFTPISGGTTVSAVKTDDGQSGALPIGFDFYYMGAKYTSVYASSNGFLSFNSSSTSVSATNNRTNSLSGSVAGLRPLIAPLWDDLDGTSVGTASYVTTGTAPNRVFTFEWLNWEWNYSANAAVISFQVKLYETSGQIQFVYRSDATAYNSGSSGASIGLAATSTGSGNYVSLSSLGSAATASTTTEVSSIATKPTTGQTYTFNPQGSTSPTTLSFTSVTTTGMTLNWTDNSTDEVGFAIYQSTDGTNYTYNSTIAAHTGTGATSAAITGLTSNTTYYWRVYAIREALSSSSASGSQATSAILAPPTLAATTNPTSVDNNFTATYTTNTAYTNAITSISITNGTTPLTLTSGTDYTLSGNNTITFTPSATGNTYLRTPGTYTITVNATGYSANTVSQTLTVGVATKLVIGTQPAAPATNGAVLGTQPTVKITDKYGNTTASTATVTATVGAGTWTIGGTTNIAGVNGTATFTNLTATSAAAVTGAAITFTSPGLTSITSGTFNIPAPPPANDQCAGAQVISDAGPFPYLTTIVDNISATTTNDPSPTGGNGSSSVRGVWYKFTPATTGVYTFSTCSSVTGTTTGDNEIAIYTGTCGGTYSQIAFNDDAGSTLCSNQSNLAIVTTNLTAGTSYFILVYNYSSSTATGSVQIQVTKVPTITTTGTLTAFSQTVGTPSAPQSYTVSGSGLSSNVTVTPPANYEVSLSSTSGYGTSLLLPVSSDGTITGQPVTVYVRLNAATTGSFSGNVANASTSSTTVNVAVSGTTAGPCTAPNAPASLTLTAITGGASITGTFPASSPTPTGYMVVRTTSSTPPATPVNGTTYTAGTSALGGYIVSYKTTTGFTDNGLTPSTTYYYWVYAYNNTSCTGGPAYSAALSGNATTATCTTATNTMAITGAAATYDWNTAANWSLGHAPYPCENAVITYTRTTNSSPEVDVNLSSNVTVNNLTITGSWGGTGTKVLWVDASNYNLTINGNLSITSTGGSRAATTDPSATYLVAGSGGSITVNGNAIIGGTSDTRYSVLGSDGDAATININGNLTYNANAATNSSELTAFIFNGTSPQTVTYNSTYYLCDFGSATIGNGNASSVTIAGGENVAGRINGGYLTINANATLKLPNSTSLNQATAGSGTFTINNGGILQVGGSSGGYSTGNNFPSGFGTYTLGTSSTVVYNGNAVQSIAVPGSYGNLTISNSSSVGVVTSGATTVTGVLTMSDGILTTTSGDLTVTNISPTAITGGSSASYVSGLLNWTLAPGLTNSTNIYIFPVGSNSTYLPYSVTGLTTGSAPPVLQVRAYSGTTGGSGDGTTLAPSALSTTEYWSAIVVTGGTISNASVSLTRQTPVSPYNVVARSATQGGTYTSIGGTPSGNSIINSNAFAPTGTQYFVMAQTPTVAIATALSPTSVSTCAGTASANMTLSVSGGGLTSDLVVTAPTGFEVSLSANSGFASSVTISNGGTVASTVVYVRLSASDAAGTYSGDITVSSSGAASKTTAISASVVSAATVFTQQPDNQDHDICQNSLTPFTLTATATGSGTLTYQWYKNTQGTNTGGTSVGSANGGNTSTYTVPNSTTGASYYYVVVHSSTCGDLPSNVSGRITVVNTNIGTQPSATPQIICQTAPGVYAASAISVSNVSGIDYEFTWYSTTTKSNTTGSPIPGAPNSKTLPSTFINTSVEGTTYYYVVVSGQCGDVHSELATVTVNRPSVAPTSVVSSLGSTICAGQSTTLNLNGGAGTNTTIRWYTGSCGGTAVGTGNNFSVSPTTTATYYGRYEDPAPCNTVTACASITINVNSVPTATIGGTNTVCQNSGNQVITFTGANGTAPYTFTYTINNGAPQMATTNSGNSATVTQSTATAGAYTYTLIGVHDNSTTQCSGSVNSNAIITVNTTPTASISAGSITSSCAAGIQLFVTGTPDAIVTYTINGGSSQTVQLTGGSAQLTTSSDANTYTYAITNVSLGNCSSVPTTGNNVMVTVYGQPTLTTSNANATQCGYSAITPVVYTLGGSASSATLAVVPNDGSFTGSYDAATKQYSIIGAPKQAVTYHYTITSNSNGDCASATAEGNISISPYSWIGGNNGNDWSTAANWCGGIPASGAPVTISANTNKPVLNQDITVGSLTLNDNTLSLNGHKLTLNGTFNGNGTLTSTPASDLVTSATTTVAFTNGSNTLHNLQVASGTLTLGNALNITSGTQYGVVSVTNGAVLATGGNLTLKSDANGTAAIGPNTSGGNYITGTVTVERFTDAIKLGGTTPHRAWRLMTSPVTGITIHNGWQEGAANTADNPNPGYGTLISGEGLSQSAAEAAGFDWIGGGNHTSIKEYTNGAWVQLATNNSATGTKIDIRTKEAYMLFVRGNRAIKGTDSSVANIRAKGSLMLGDHTVTIGSGAYTLVGNPYASTLDFGSVVTHSGNLNAIQDKFYLWNSHLSNYGAYVLVDHNGTGGTTYEATPAPFPNNGVEDDKYRYIPSGSGFFVSPAVGAGSTTLTISEGDKAVGNMPPVSPFRVVPNATNVRQLLVNLNQKLDDTLFSLTDGFRAKFSPDYEGNEEDNSSIKADNFYENLGLVRNGVNHIIEARGEVKKSDTLQLKMWNVSYRNYELQIKGDNFISAPGIKAWLVDSYKGTKQEVNLSGSITTVSFDVNKDSGSWKSTRFMIVFENSGAVLPVTITKVSASPKNGGAEVSWTVTNEVNVKGYTVEKSNDGGRTFTSTGTQQPAKNNPQAAVTSYSGYDATPKPGDNYYRIRIEGKDGSISYSQVVKVTIGANGSGIRITLYPNPVREGKANLTLTNLKEGTYLVSVFSGSGQTVYQKKVTVTLSGTSQTEQLLLGNNLAQGSYQIRVADHTGVVLYTDKLIIGR